MIEVNPVGLARVVVGGIDMATKRSEECELDGVRYIGIGLGKAESHTNQKCRDVKRCPEALE